MAIELHILKVLQLFDTNCFNKYIHIPGKKERNIPHGYLVKKKKIVKQNIVFIKSQTTKSIFGFTCVSLCVVKILVLGRVFKKVKGNGISNCN